MATLAGCGEKPTESNFQLEEGFKIELVASEPLITDPVDMEIDEYGRLYVVEMPGYPLDKSGSGRVILLTDSNADGKMDTRTVFADNLVLPNSIMRWKAGVIVTDAPNVIYFEDSDGDGHADVRDTLLTGFALSNPQHNLNNPVLGINNWIYLAHEGAVGTETYAEEFGDPGHQVYFPDQPLSPRLNINAGGRAVRFRPDQHQLEMTSSYSQFGQTFDAWGHHLEVSNANHIFQEVIEARYLERNPALLVSNATESISDHGAAAEVFPITINPENQLLTDVGVITSACGLTAYLGGAFPAPYDHATFVAEPVSNLVHVDLLKDTGATFIARRLHPHKEFLASRDPKFRPVNMYVGPDGALYVVDYYRQIIEHPEWMGEEVVKSGALYNDTDKGRIYRISTTNASEAEWIKGLSLGKQSVDQLVEELSNANIWWRLNAQRLLIDRAGKNAVPPLIQMASGKSAFGRLHALWTLEGIGDLTPELLAMALKDSVAGIRENAIKLSELRLAESPGLADLLLAMQDDKNDKVRYQLLCTLGYVNTSEAAKARDKILFHDLNDKWVQIAALSASSSQTSGLLEQVLQHYQKDVPAYASLTRRLAAMVGMAGPSSTVNSLIREATDMSARDDDAWKGPVLEGLAMGLENNKLHLASSLHEQQALIDAFFTHPSIDVRRGSLALLRTIGIRDEAAARAAIERAVKIAQDRELPDDTRAAAIDFISLQNPAPYSSTLMDLFVPREQLSVQLAALRTLSTVPDTAICIFLIAQWPALTPELRDPAIKTFFENEQRIAMLLNSVASGKIPATDLSWPRKVRLMAQSNDLLRNQARALFTMNNITEINKAYQAALQTKGDAINGKAVFLQQCSICHQIRGQSGVKFGPDLGTIHNWSREAIMANILAPDQSISSGYDLW